MGTDCRMVTQRVQRGFEGLAQEAKVEYLHELRANWKDLEAKIARKLVLVITVAAIGELSIVKGIGEFTIAGVRVEDLSVVVLLTPIVVAYLMYDLAVGIALVDAYGEAHDALERITYPELAKEKLEQLLIPSGSIIWASPGVTWFAKYGSLPGGVSASESFWLARALGGLISPPLFLVFYYTQLIRQQADWTVYASLVICFVILTMALIQTATWLRHR